MGSKQWGDTDSDSEQEPITADWFIAESANTKEVTQPPKASDWDPKREEAAKDNIVVVDPGNELQIRKPPPKEVRQQIIKQAGLEDREEMAGFLQASQDAQSKPSKGLAYKCNWCYKPGVKSERLLVHYNVSEWRAGCFRLCFDCCQGKPPKASQFETGQNPVRYYQSQPDDFNFLALAMSEDKPAGVWLDPSAIATGSSSSTSTDHDTPLAQRIVKPGTCKLSMDSGVAVNGETPAALESKAVLRDRRPQLPRIDIDWKQQQYRPSDYDRIRVQAFSCNFFEIHASDGTPVCTDMKNFQTLPQMRPPNWGWDHDNWQYLWQYSPMFSGDTPYRSFKRACSRAWTQWDACQALDFCEMRAQSFQRCSRSLAQQKGVAVSALDYKDRVVGLRDSNFAVSLCAVLPPVPRAINEPQAAYKARLVAHFDKVVKMGELFDRWEKDFAYRIDPRVQKDFCHKLYQVDHFMAYLDKITDTHHEFFLCRKCGHFGPSAQWIEHGGSYLCPREDCHWSWHGRGTTNHNSALLPATHVWAITVKHFKTPEFALDHSQPEACLPGNESTGVPASARSSSDPQGSIATRRPMETPPAARARMNPLLTGDSILTESSISLEVADAEAAIRQKDYQFALIDWSQCLGHEGAIVMNEQIKRELKSLWNDLRIEGETTDLQALADRVWDQIQRVERQAYFTEYEVPDDYLDQVRRHLDVWQPHARKRELSIAHWPSNSKRRKYFDSARVDMTQFPEQDLKRLEKVMDYRKQLQHWGRARFWINVSKDNFHEVKRWMMVGDIQEDTPMTNA